MVIRTKPASLGMALKTVRGSRIGFYQVGRSNVGSHMRAHALRTTKCRPRQLGGVGSGELSLCCYAVCLSRGNSISTWCRDGGFKLYEKSKNARRKTPNETGEAIRQTLPWPAQGGYERGRRIAQKSDAVAICEKRDNWMYIPNS